MARTVSTNLQNILNAKTREIDYTLVLTFPDASVLRFATSPLVISSQTYTNDLENVGEIRQTLENPIDRVAIGLQNKDRVLSLHIAANWQKWRKATAVIGRLYRDGDGLGLSEWVEMFRGAVQQPQANDLKVTFDVITDTIAKGDIVCNLTLAPNCQAVFKDPKTCAYVGIETKCDHFLTTKTGCDGRVNSEHFLGMQHRYPPSASVPGTGGNSGGGGGGGNCPRLDQWILVRGDYGQIRPMRVSALNIRDYLFNPISGEFHAIHSLEIVRNEPIFEMIAANGAVCFSSFSHKVLWYREHLTGEVVTKSIKGDPILTLIDYELTDSKIVFAHDSADTDDVMRIEMKDGHIYASGDSPGKLIVAHNLKNPYDEINPFEDI